MLMSILSRPKKKNAFVTIGNSLNAGFETIDFLGHYVMRQLKKWTTIVVPGTGDPPPTPSRPWDYFNRPRISVSSPL